MRVRWLDDNITTTHQESGNMGKLFGRDFKVWHDACHDGVRSGMAERASRGFESGHWSWEVYQGELAAIKAVIDKLPATEQAIGMVLFAPDFTISRKYVLKVRTHTWALFLRQWPERVKSPEAAGRAYTLLGMAIEQARFNYVSCNTAIRSQREMAMVLDCSQTLYVRDWKPVLDKMVDELLLGADKALQPIRHQINVTNKKYCEAA